MGRIGQEAISVMKVMHPSVLQVSEGNFLEVRHYLLFEEVVEAGEH